jgi:putative transposase
VIARHRGEYPLTLMCRVLDVAPSGFYAWETRGPSVRAQTDAALRVRIAAMHTRSRQEYGARLHQQALRATGQHISRRRTRRLMQEAQCVALQPRRWQVTTQADATAHRRSRNDHLAAQVRASPRPAVEVWLLWP